MKKYNLNQFTRGWIVGDFEPSIIRTKEFECMVRSYKVGEKDPKHVHKKASEITVIINGEFLMNGQKISSGDIIHLDAGDPAEFECLVDGNTAVIKTPSVLNDKFTLN